MPEAMELIKVGEAAERLGISRYTVYGLIRQDEIPAYRLGKKTLLVDWTELMRRWGKAS